MPLHSRQCYHRSAFKHKYSHSFRHQSSRVTFSPQRCFHDNLVLACSAREQTHALATRSCTALLAAGLVLLSSGNDPVSALELPAGIKEFEDKLLDQIPGLKAEQPPISFGKKSEMSPVEKLFKPNDPQVKAEREQKQKDKEKRTEQESREKEEREKAEKIKKEQERIKKEREELFRKQAILGGSALGLGALFIGKWQAVAAGVALLFRTVGGPTILSNVLRSPGLLFGRSLRVVEWDVAKSPNMPNGRVVSFTLRAQTPVGLRQAIVKNCGLSDGRDVKQICHWIPEGPQFFEPLTTVPSFRMLPDPSWIVWSRRARKGADAIPYRLDEQELAVDARNSFAGLAPAQEAELMLRTLNSMAAITRGLPVSEQLAHHFGYEDAGDQLAANNSSPMESRSLSPSGNGASNPNGSTSRSAKRSKKSSDDEGSVRAAEEFMEDERKRQDKEELRRRSIADKGGLASSADEEENQQIERNQAAVAKMRTTKQAEPFDGSARDPAGKGGGLESPAESMAARSTQSVVGVAAEAGRVYRRIADAAADPLNATKYAVGLPTPDCGNSEDANVPGPSTGGQGAEFRDNLARSERFQNAAGRLTEGIKGVHLPSDYPVVSDEEEAALIALAVSDAKYGITQLFRVYAISDPLKFLRFSRAIAKRNDQAG